MKLYHVPLTRSIRVVWLLEEMGITDYELVTISRDDWHDFAKSDEYQAVNMLGKYPGMRDGDLTMVESVAIMEYAIAKYGANGLAPASDDPEYGEYLSGECTSCHQASGSDAGIPSIIHWPEDDFVLAMHAYKRKQRAHPVMQMIAGRLGDEEIAALAAYFANLSD